MPNRYQLAFLGSFITVFVTLFLISQYLNAKLLAAGYDISELILIGIPKDQLRPKPPHPKHIQTNTMSSTLIEQLQNDATTQTVALAVAVITTAFIWTKVIHTGKRKPVLDPKEWKEFPLTEKIVLSPNTAIYRFGLPHPQDILGLPIGQHVSVSAEINGKDITRSYTPTSSDDDLGHFDLLVKAYEKGNISRYLSLLTIGDKVRIKGPKGQFIYTPDLADSIGMIAGGTGITPMLQIVHAALKNPLDQTKLSLIYANVTSEDILLKEELDKLAEQHPDRFSVYYVLNVPPEGWTGGVGFVSKQQIEERLPATGDRTKILMCGPPPMMGAMKKYLDELKYPAPRTVSKLVDQVFLF